SVNLEIVDPLSLDGLVGVHQIEKKGSGGIWKETWLIDDIERTRDSAAMGDDMLAGDTLLWDNTKQASVEVLDGQDSEAGLILHTKRPTPFPRWPRILGAALNIFVLLASVSIIAVLVHSLSNYSGSRGIHFGGTASSWPKDLDLRPAYLVLSVSALSIMPGLLSTVIGLRRSKAPSYSRMEKILVFIGGALLVMWIASVSLQGVSEQTPKRDLLRWACRRRDSPTNILVSYTSVCDEQVAIKCLSILITIAEMAAFVSGVATWCLVERRSKLLDEPWRAKA
ncbi:MAG: hypothetical protein Q9224_005051, partial [Gallowayella concinna]